MSMHVKTCERMLMRVDSTYAYTHGMSTCVLVCARALSVRLPFAIVLSSPLIWDLCVRVRSLYIHTYEGIEAM